MNTFRTSCIGLVFVLTGGTQAIGHAEAQPFSKSSAGPALFMSNDSEGFYTRRVEADFFPIQNDDGDSVGLRYRHHRFSQQGWTRNGEQLAIAGKGPVQEGGRVWQGEAGALIQGRHTLLTLDGNYAIAFSKDTSAEIFINRDFVETQAALDQGIHFTFTGGSLEHRVHPKFTLVTVVGYQDFSDDNQRRHFRFRAIFQPDLDLGLTLQYRYRYFTSSPNEVRRAYFNPERYQENMLLAGWRKRYQGWTGRILGGVGTQHITDSPDTPSKLLELAVDSPPKAGQVFGMRAGYLRNAAFSGPDYWYQYVQGTWTLRF